ncbi:MAG TPA: tRNA (N(6)-L-threonylcarbamoyladenosine(37)-C(2))-methylthiotransferase MtaB [Alphaproteobacteria bacterium]|jgi:threonylcarbamoyladenosine tRNA methylthiotransferase MtaB|nr:tRNA (N(6)-L-threonylcarbamoyladenosine(37)-C(2))-methylthiotransferase MtaB [Alphaproteobacteria bacterium]
MAPRDDEAPEAVATDTDVVTFGCRLNAYESEAMLRHARAAGLANAVIVNTCAVTAEAERQARQTIRKIRRERPDAFIVATGCAAQTNPAMFASMPEVDRVVGNAEKMEPATFLDLRADAHPRVVVGDIGSVRETASHLVGGFDGRARAFVQVQQGCDHRCTFCIIPYGRGPSRSVPLGDIVRETRTLAERGIPELVLSGVDLTSFGADLPGTPTLGQMVRRLLALVPELKRLRLSSIDVAEIDDDLMGLIADEPRLMPHLHLSLQAGDDLILKRMKRRHSRAQAIDFAAHARTLRPDVVLGADLIAGFPTETESMFANTLALVEDCGLTHLHVFPYSARSGTPAAKMPQVPHELRRERAARLRSAGSAALAKTLAGRIGRTEDVAVEKPGFGRTAHYLAARLEGAFAEAPAGTVVRGVALAAEAEALVVAPAVVTQ